MMQFDFDHISRVSSMARFKRCSFFCKIENRSSIIVSLQIHMQQHSSVYSHNDRRFEIIFIYYVGYPERLARKNTKIPRKMLSIQLKLEFSVSKWNNCQLDCWRLFRFIFVCANETEINMVRKWCHYGFSRLRKVILWRPHVPCRFLRSNEINGWQSAKNNSKRHI